MTLDGVVWQETEGGVLVVNVTWREKSYVGTLLDCTKHDWAPPRLCESPLEETEVKGKRGKRRAVTQEMRGLRSVKRRTGNLSSPRKPEVATRSETSSSSKSTLIECPEPNCNKKYKHINGLKYHQTHAHDQHSKKEETTKPESKEAPSPAYSDISDDEEDSSSKFRPENNDNNDNNFPFAFSSFDDQSDVKDKKTDVKHEASSNFYLHSHPAFSPSMNPLMNPLWTGMSNGLTNQFPATNAEKTAASNPSSPQDKSQEPPPQRHLHTHHHTHVGYPAVSVVPAVLPTHTLYDPAVYNGEYNDDI